MYVLLQYIQRQASSSATRNRRLSNILPLRFRTSLPVGIWSILWFFFSPIFLRQECKLVRKQKNVWLPVFLNNVTSHMMNNGTCCYNGINGKYQQSATSWRILSIVPMRLVYNDNTNTILVIWLRGLFYVEQNWKNAMPFSGYIIHKYSCHIGSMSI